MTTTPPSVESLHQETEHRMKKAIETAQQEMSKLRTGRANPLILERVQVEYYGALTPVNQMASVSVSEGQTLVIQPFDKSQLGEIEKAISKADLGVNPNNDGMVIRLNFPPLSEERRKELAKLVKKNGEEAHVAIRNVRRHALEQLDKFKKDENLSEDDVRRRQEEIQKLTDRYIKLMDTVAAEKEKEVMSV